MQQHHLPQSELKSQHLVDSNALQSQEYVPPISRIPLDVFLEILSMVLGVMGNSVDRIYSLRHTMDYYKELQRLRLVASAWSTLIDQTPKFWIYVDAFAPEEIWRAAFQKSKKMKISVDCISHLRPPNTRLHQSFVNELSIHAPRIRSLDIMEKDLREIVSKDAEMAGLVSLHVKRYLTDRFAQRSPEISLAKWTPNVQNVELLGCSFNWPDPGWTNMKSLKLVHGDPATIFDTLQLLNILAGSPTLERLILHGQVPTEAPDTTRLPQIHLGALKTLKLNTYSTRGLFQLLDSIIAFPTDQFDVSFFVESTEPPRLRTFGRFAGLLKEKQVDSLSMAASGNYCRVQLGGFCVRAAFGSTLGAGALNALDGILEGIQGSLLREVERVDLTADIYNVVPSLIPIVHARCPRICHFSLQSLESGVSSLFNRNSSSPRWLFPHLTTITLSPNRQLQILEMVGAIQARSEAFKAGVLPAQVIGLKLKVSDSQRVQFEDVIKDVRKLVPEVTVEARTPRGVL
ncbi:hypothetical protein FRC04_012150 [Tulasnella sp. 424]|nr:hypothetical protein FRC04_012150 [Tulasnella sp. 424]KAG8971042.1 hypothetical protein FRC05_011508 [Tulasnella sp. 425]